MVGAATPFSRLESFRFYFESLNDLCSQDEFRKLDSLFAGAHSLQRLALSGCGLVAGTLSPAGDADLNIIAHSFSAANITHIELATSNAPVDSIKAFLLCFAGSL